MWWINKNGNIEGPFSSEQLEKRVKVNMLRSLDRVSEDKANGSMLRIQCFGIRPERLRIRHRHRHRVLST